MLAVQIVQKPGQLRKHLQVGALMEVLKHAASLYHGFFQVLVYLGANVRKRCQQVTLNGIALLGVI